VDRREGEVVGEELPVEIRVIEGEARPEKVTVPAEEPEAAAETPSEE
jgi:hypothetical protein